VTNAQFKEGIRAIKFVEGKTNGHDAVETVFTHGTDDEEKIPRLPLTVEERMTRLINEWARRIQRQLDEIDADLARLVETMKGDRK